MGEYLGMRFDSLQVKKFVIALALVMATITPVLAADNVISQVVISKSKNRPNAYELNIDSSQIVRYKSYIDGNNNVYFDLKNSTLAKGLGTVYDDVSNIDNVTVRQLDKNKVRIYVNGKNARNTELVFVNSMFETSKDTASKKIVINRPINEYKSTSYADNDLENQTDIQDWDDNSFNVSHLSSTILGELKDGVAGKVLILLSLFLVLVGILKNLSRKLSQDREPLIGLNSQTQAINPTNHIGSVGAKVVRPRAQEELPSAKTRSEALRLAQIELTKAHQKYQQYIQNKYQGLQKPKSIDVDSLKKSIALNQYQKSTQNPYKNQEVIRLNKGFTTDTQTLRGQIPPRPKMQQKV